MIRDFPACLRINNCQCFAQLTAHLTCASASSDSGELGRRPRRRCRRTPSERVRSNLFDCDLHQVNDSISVLWRRENQLSARRHRTAMRFRHCGLAPAGATGVFKHGFCELSNRVAGDDHSSHDTLRTRQKRRACHFTTSMMRVDNAGTTVRGDLASR